jgi:hypothetical protein
VTEDEIVAHSGNPITTKKKQPIQAEKTPRTEDQNTNQRRLYKMFFSKMWYQTERNLLQEELKRVFDNLLELPHELSANSSINRAKFGQSRLS